MQSRGKMVRRVKRDLLEKEFAVSMFLIANLKKMRVCNDMILKSVSVTHV